ncbi:hypothetical protein CO172_02930 [Candidatus Uhrbacteria bacterium CG_4_9_14_3_um_filter_36_7]|uniref:Uncharacterized protein n=1 Tax=Candidatus Uhrbacteria bacterium CG_4_9_14_3_um_filter_36_7 TaxID=1975033 RepID=A0A2M7XH11_9BACT|nr:MAG: hypothetical protein CO172_02930 [Candidatus Uhrbacteria bacterium CG_4_9_14_3_um_filter_36_7]
MSLQVGTSPSGMEWLFKNEGQKIFVFAVITSNKMTVPLSITRQPEEVRLMGCREATDDDLNRFVQRWNPNHGSKDKWLEQIK